MFRLLIASLFLSAIYGFMPVTKTNSRVSTSLSAERSKSLPFLLRPAKLDGTLAGDEGFDPLGLSNIEELGIDLYWLREAELKHSRIAMLAVVGAVGQELGIIFPGQPTGKNQIDVFWQFYDSNPGPFFAGLLAVSFFELISGLAITEGRKSGDRAPGDFGFKSWGKTPSEVKSYELKEIRNGRLAMWAAAGILLQGSVTDTGAVDNLF
mmetsp:Transcript_25013/g.22730  ORF Transcript_25013/g.22730 Transcript_25013/m.22730 type:complete len:209 (+) Transcript_25013:70-696(+)